MWCMNTRHGRVFVPVWNVAISSTGEPSLSLSEEFECSFYCCDVRVFSLVYLEGFSSHVSTYFSVFSFSSSLPYFSFSEAFLLRGSSFRAEMWSPHFCLSLSYSYTLRSAPFSSLISYFIQGLTFRDVHVINFVGQTAENYLQSSYWVSLALTQSTISCFFSIVKSSGLRSSFSAISLNTLRHSSLRSLSNVAILSVFQSSYFNFIIIHITKCIL